MNELSDMTKKAFGKYDKDRNLRNTCQRNEIIDAFLKTERHITAEELHKIVNKKQHGIGSATIGRTLKLLCESGIAEEIKIGRKRTLFEHKFGHKHHDHLICEKCGNFIEITSPQIEKLQN